jgi:hypothetical protein
VVQLLVAERDAADEEVGGVGRIGLPDGKIRVFAHPDPQTALFFENGQKGRGEATDGGFPAVVGLANGDPVGGYG